MDRTYQSTGRKKSVATIGKAVTHSGVARGPCGSTPSTASELIIIPDNFLCVCVCECACIPMHIT